MMLNAVVDLAPFMLSGSEESDVGVPSLAICCLRAYEVLWMHAGRS